MLAAIDTVWAVGRARTGKLAGTRPWTTGCVPAGSVVDRVEPAHTGVEGKATQDRASSPEGLACRIDRSLEAVYFACMPHGETEAGDWGDDIAAEQAVVGGIQFETAMHRRVYEHVANLLGDLYSDLVAPLPSVPAFRCALAGENGSAIAYTYVVPGANDVVVRTLAWVLRDVAPSSELYTDLLRRNAIAEFGSYFLNEQGDVGYAHTIVGSTLDRLELEESTKAVATRADVDGYELQQAYGGRRAGDDVLAE